MDTATKIRHLQATATFVHDRMSTNEGSHDLRHVYRVQHLAQRFAAELQLSGVDVDVFIVRMAALLHDVFDSKLYTPSEENDHKTGEELLTRFLAVDRGLQAGNVQHIVRIAEGISYSKQLKCPMDESLRSIEMNIVEDADRIESIGAIGVARCIAYSGSLMNSLEESRLHFDDKMVKLLSLMRTEPGKRLAKSRHDFLVLFMSQLDSEYAFAGQSSRERGSLDLNSFEVLKMKL